MAAFLRLFPLPLVVFPGESVNLHIFEPRYRELIRECLDQKESFGIPAQIHDQMDLGTEVEIELLQKEYPGGEMDIRVLGKRVFRTETFFQEHSGKLYPAGMVRFLKEESSEDQTVRTKLLDIFDQLIGLISEKEVNLKPNAFLSYYIGHHCALSKSQELELLALRRESLRQQYLLRHLNDLLPKVLELEALKERIRQNGHFRPLSSENP